MGLKDVLNKHDIPLPTDFDERLDIMTSILRRSPGYQKKLNAYKTKQDGGADDDFLGPEIENFIDVVTSPEARGALQGLFTVLFFVSYLEKIPVFGSVLSAVLDLMIMGGKMVTKTVQKNLPPLIGLIPLPFASMIGLGLAAVFGMIVWPVIAMVSFSRKKFKNAAESMIRVVPPPFGDTIADLFLEANSAAASLNKNRKALADDISEGIELVSDIAGTVSDTVKQGATTLADKTKEAGMTPETEFSVRPATAMAAGKRLSRRVRMNKKWRTRRQKPKHKRTK